MRSGAGCTCERGVCGLCACSCLVWWQHNELACLCRHHPPHSHTPTHLPTRTHTGTLTLTHTDCEYTCPLPSLPRPPERPPRHPDHALPLPATAAAIPRHSVTTSSAVPSQLQALAREVLTLHGPEAVAAGKAPCSTLQRVLSGGEALTTTMAQDITAAMPQCKLFNTYGPTETTVGECVID